ncbi:hypothetical protein L9F63_019900, partial [Diploptera punctata]
MTSSGMNLLSSSDDDVVVMKHIVDIQVERHDKKMSKTKNDSFNRSTEVLILDKKLKNERNSNHQNVRNNNEVEIVRNDINTENINDLQVVKELDNKSPDKQILSTFNDSIKKPVPLPRSKISRKSPQIDKNLEKESSNLLKQNYETSGSLSLLLPSNEQQDIKDSTDDNVCIAKPKIGRRRKKKKDSLENKEYEDDVELKDLKPFATCVQTKETPKKKPPVKPKRRSKEAVDETEIAKDEEQQQRITNLTYEKVIGIFIHKCDSLKIDSLIRHPLVKVHLLDAETGEYLKKSDAGRSVSFHSESSNVDYILPLMTDVFDFKERRSLIPYWEELLVFNEDFKCILTNETPVIILFEILDFVNFTIASSQYSKLGSEGGWHHIAWAFLKPVGANGVMNTEKQVRLQLYKPQHVRKTNCNNCDVYQWWSKGVWKRYPATLYVTIKGITPPEHLPPVLRSRSALQGEISQPSPFLDLDHNQDEIEAKSDNENSMISAQLPAANSLPAWSRMPSQSCKIPNHRKLTLPTASRGCFYVKFSNSGLNLACSIVTEEKYNVIVYSIPDGKELVQFLGHQGLVYDLHWSPKDTMLLSASADCTACLWDMEARKSAPMQMLPHPSFVYCAQFHCGNSSVLVTGCCDHIVRIWTRQNKSSQYELIQELEGHTGFVSAVTMSTNGMLYSADSLGLIIEWMGAKGKLKKQWNIDIRELRDCVINKLHLHPGGQRLLIHVRDSRLRMLDLSTASIIQWFHGALNHRVQTSACLSPCGGLVLAASEDGTARVWNADTGEQLAIYSGLQFIKAASGVDYHPYEHMAAFASFGSPAQVIIADYEKLSSGNDVGLQILHQQEVTVLPTSHTGMGDMNESCARSSTTLNFSQAELPLSSGKKKKKTFPTVDNELGNISDSLTAKDLSRMSNRTLSSSGVLSPSKDQDSEYSRIKLANIIEKMDLVLSTTPSKSSQQLSGSFKNIDSK